MQLMGGTFDNKAECDSLVLVRRGRELPWLERASESGESLSGAYCWVLKAQAPCWVIGSDTGCLVGWWSSGLGIMNVLSWFLGLIVR